MKATTVLIIIVVITMLYLSYTAYSGFNNNIDVDKELFLANMSKEQLDNIKSDTDIKMPDKKEYEIPLPAKIFSSGREGFYAQIPALVYEDEVYGGQIQIWKKTPKT